MSYTAPKTWQFKETWSSEDANTYVRDNIIYLNKNTPIGEIKMFGGATAPEGFLFCRGQEINRTTYADLYAIVGTYFGVGNGSTTFNLPDTQGRTVFGVSTTDGTFGLGDTGGSKTINVYHRHYYSHTHTHYHTHTYSGTTSYEDDEDSFDSGSDDGANAEHRHTYSGTTSGANVGSTSGPNTNYTNYSGSSTLNSLNPFVTMNFIIKY